MKIDLEHSYRNVCDAIVANDLCIGCGLCVGVCPPQVLDMNFNGNGEYIAIENREGCLPKCDICLKACPFWEQTDNEDTLAQKAFGLCPDIQHTSETGYYTKIFAGHSLLGNQRKEGASGGLATWFLQTLLKEGIVDRVVSVAPNDKPEKLFHFTICDTPDEVSKSAKSCYYPVEMSEIIREILHTEGRYAVIGLPCFLKAIRLAMRQNTRLRRRIVILAGLTCGQTKSKFFAEYLCALGGGTPTQMNRAIFRVKDLNRPANNFGFRFECGGEAVQDGTIFWLDGMGDAWGRGYFKPNACSHCDDIFAEVADIVFMDAWLDRFICDGVGSSFAIIRQPSLVSLFEDGQSKGTIHLEDISIEDVIKSQQPVIDMKRSGLAERLAMAQKLGTKKIPTKRVRSASITTYRFCQLWLDKLIISTSKDAFRKQRVRSGLGYFNWRMSIVLFLKKVINYIQIRAARIGISL